MRRHGRAFLAVVLAVAAGPAWTGDWTPEQSAELLAATRTIRLAPDLSALTPAERVGLDALLEAGHLVQELYEDALHRQAASARAELDAAGETAGALRTLFRLFEGPVATTLDNRRVPFMDVEAAPPGKNVYPWGVEKAEVDAFLAAHPERRDEILGERTVVRRNGPEQRAHDLEALARHPVLDALHPGLRERLQAPVTGGFYAVPYAVAWADRVVNAYGALQRAAAALEATDAEFARYLRNRGRDLLSNDYESGDASWVTGRFGKLNAQIGAYETYDDALFGVKAGWSLSLLLRDEVATSELRAGLAGIQEIEDALPYEQRKRVREDIPVGVYDVVADFGQARGTNTATILPNDALFSRRYGRTILMRANIIRHPDLFASSREAWRAVVAEGFDDHLVSEGTLQRTLWHEIGHYLGVDRDAQGRSLDVALGTWADALEEVKSDLVSLFAAERLAERGVHDAARLQAIRASGIRRTLQNNRPRADQPYQTMQLAQYNHFRENGLLDFDAERGELTIQYERYPEVVRALLAEVLQVQHAGDPERARVFFERYGAWTEDEHAALAAKIRAAQGPPFTLVRYAALGE